MGALGDVEVLPPSQDAPFEHVRVASPGADGVSRTLFAIPKPGIASAVYAVAGKVRYEGVEGRGYLELWNEFPGNRKQFTRSLDGKGLLKWLEGTSAWRPFLLPFYRTGGSPPPEKLTLNIVLPHHGSVEVGDLSLIEYAPGEDPMVPAGQWWTGREGGIIGGALGGLIGCLGAAIGWLSSKGRARRFVVGALWAMVVFGLVVAALGALAVFREQPYVVYYPLLLVGGLSVVVGGVMIPVVRRRCAALDKAHAALPRAVTR